MSTRFQSFISLTTRGFDDACGLFLLLLVFASVNVGRMPSGTEDFLSARLTVKNVVLLAVFLVIWHLSFSGDDLSVSQAPYDVSRQARSVIRATSLGTLPLLLFLLTSHSGAFSISVVVGFWAVATLVALVGRSVITVLVRAITRQSVGSLRAVIIGSGWRARDLLMSIQDGSHSQYRVLGFIDDPGPHAVSEEVAARLIGTLDDLPLYLARNGIDEVLIALPIRACHTKVQHVIGICEPMGVAVQYFVDAFDVSHAKSTSVQAFEMPGVRLTHVADDYRLVIKRAIDIVGAAAGLIVLSPVFLVCGLLVKLSGPGPVVFSQMRYGFNRRRFRLYKFRTMVANAEAQVKSLEALNEATGPLFKIGNDPRITPIGRFLRRTSLDELPQLFNVLIGDMSLVGPRPLSLRDTYRLNESRMLRRFSVRPGLTCLWQVSGRSNAGADLARLDLTYIDNWSLSLDARILLKTVPVVISGTGAG